METLFSFLMNLIFGRRWLKYQFKAEVKRVLFYREIDLNLTSQVVKKLEWEISELDARLKTLADKKEIDRAVSAKSSREKALEMGIAQVELLKKQIENDKRKLTL